MRSKSTSGETQPQQIITSMTNFYCYIGTLSQVQDGTPYTCGKVIYTEGVTGYLIRCTNVPFGLIIDASLSSCGARARSNEKTWLFNRRALFAFSRNAVTSCESPNEPKHKNDDCEVTWGLFYTPIKHVHKVSFSISHTNHENILRNHSFPKHTWHHVCAVERQLGYLQ